MSKQAIFIVAQQTFRDEELLEPKAILEQRGIRVKIASKTRHKASGKLGTEIEPDLALAEINPTESDALIFVGGSGSRQYFDDPEALRLASSFKVAGKLVASICIASSILANAGILMGKRVTGFPTEEENIINHGGEYTGMQVEVDGSVVTAKDPSAAKEFGEALAYLLEG
ncbi:MAG: DJ-1/PfpI family protein [Patescibacteria group bacterium]|nr:DJ-1/PfpI family protein [Patescibacteria group bacterium]